MMELAFMTTTTIKTHSERDGSIKAQPISSSSSSSRSREPAPPACSPTPTSRIYSLDCVSSELYRKQDVERLRRMCQRACVTSNVERFLFPQRESLLNRCSGADHCRHQTVTFECQMQGSYFVFPHQPQELK